MKREENSKFSNSKVLKTNDSDYEKLEEKVTNL
jgi:hypothetical protein